jgi:hypothetical protein
MNPRLPCDQVRAATDRIDAGIVARRPAKKSELLRAGLKALAAPIPAQLAAALLALTPVKTEDRNAAIDSQGWPRVGGVHAAEVCAGWAPPVAQARLRSILWRSRNVRTVHLLGIAVRATLPRAWFAWARTSEMRAASQPSANQAAGSVATSAW